MTQEIHQPETWFLEGFTDENRHVWRTPLSVLPFRIGRSEDCQLLLDSPSVSNVHAEIFKRRGVLQVTDLDSTNGTFVNGHRIASVQALAVGDTLRFADWEFRLVEPSPPFVPVSTVELVAPLSGPAQNDPKLARQLEATVHNRSFWAVFQPIVRLADRSVVGYEALTRGSLGGVETSPAELLAIAEIRGTAAEISELFRREQLRDAARLPGGPELFLNTHPAELHSEHTLVESLRALKVHGGSPPRLCIEINEAATMDLGLLAGLREDLAALDVGVAFDDFGTGESRLLELAEMSPNYVKFDRAWVHDLHRGSERRLELVKTLVRMVEGLGIIPIAEGVEQLDEAAACREVGFELAQGFYLGRPDRVAAFL